MSIFLSPYWLWGMIGLLLLFWLRIDVPTQREIPVGSLELWQLDKSSLGGQRSRYRDPWSLWLSLLAYALLVMALAQPILLRQVPRRQMMIVLDASASMRKLTAQGTIFELAQRRLRELLHQLAPHDEVSLYAYPPQQLYQGSPNDVVTWLDRLQPTELAADFTTFFTTLTQAFPQQACYFVTDNAGSARLPFSHTTNIACGTNDTDNLGLVAFQVQKQESQWRLFAVIRNFSKQQREITLEIYADQQPLLTEKLVVPALARYGWSHTLTLESWRAVLIKLPHHDDLALDNTAYAVRQPTCNIWFPPEVPKSFARLPIAIEGMRVTPDQTAAAFAFLPVGDRGAPTEAWLIAIPDRVPQLVFDQSVAISAVVAAGDDLLQHVYPEIIPIHHARPLAMPLPDATRILLHSPAGPIMAYGPEWLYLGFSPEASGWAYLPSFPLFWQNFFDAKAPDRDRFSYVLTSEATPMSGIHPRPSLPDQAVNFIHETESDTTADTTQQPFAWPPVADNGQQQIVLWRWLTVLAGVALAGLWWHERR